MEEHKEIPEGFIRDALDTLKLGFAVARDSQINDPIVGRELKMIELKKEINRLHAESGRPVKYTIVEKRLYSSSAGRDGKYCGDCKP